MNRSRIGFLPFFFTVLAIVFVVALWVRLRSYAQSSSEQTSASVTRTNELITTSSSARDTARVAGPEAPAHATATTASTKLSRRAATSTEDWQIVPATQPSTSTATQPTRTAESPSLLSRIVAPIVNAISPDRSKAAPVPPHASASSPQQPAGRNAPTDTTASQAEKDFNSDTQAPQLLAIAFNPQQVRDGEETILMVQATDDLSGIRSISGTIAAPSGAVQGFALQRELNTDNYTAHINVPRDAADGVWRVNYLSLIDNASNATTLTSAQGSLPPTASFRVVSSRPDATGPTLKAVWIDRPAMKAGEKNIVFVDAEDDKSGINLVSGVLISPSRFARIGFVCRPGTGPWECELTTPACIDCGEWHLEQIQLQDKANNMSTVRADNPAVANLRVNITGDRCDNTQPTLQGIVLDRPVVSNVEDSIINVTATASDDLCGIMSMSGQVTGPLTAGGAPRLYFSFTPAGEGMWAGRITVPKLAAKGPWRISWIQVLDQAHNLKTYSQGEAALAGAGFVVR